MIYVFTTNGRLMKEHETNNISFRHEKDTEVKKRN